MEIKKGKVLKDREWSPSTQKKLASMLGVSVVTVIASAALTACDTTSATSGQVVEPTSSEQMTCGEMPCDGDIGPESSSSQTNFSSSIDPVGGISSSSDAPRPVSSSYEIDTLEVTSGEVIPPEIVGPESGSNIDTGHLESSSSIAEPSSSSYQRIESSSTTSGLPLSSSEAIPGDPIEIDDPKD
jgi:hypothetical protein